jgi:hypothetical protein
MLVSNTVRPVQSNEEKQAPPLWAKDEIVCLVIDKQET